MQYSALTASLLYFFVDNPSIQSNDHELKLTKCSDPTHSVKMPTVIRNRRRLCSPIRLNYDERSNIYVSTSHDFGILLV
jgi:hypothetical protein